MPTDKSLDEFIVEWGKKYASSPEDWAEYKRILEILKSGSVADFEELEGSVSDFPHGLDHCLERYWIINAIDLGSLASIEWMLTKGINLNFKDDEGQTVLLSALDRERPDKYVILDLLLKHGAPVDAHGINDWTAAYMAACRDDVEAMRVLLAHGADLSEVCDCDEATPVEAAVGQESKLVLALIREWRNQSRIQDVS
jgi:ankyrin repeat protein